MHSDCPIAELVTKRFELDWKRKFVGFGREDGERDRGRGGRRVLFWRTLALPE
jgi:hypothetical protein